MKTYQLLDSEHTLMFTVHTVSVIRICCSSALELVSSSLRDTASGDVYTADVDTTEDEIAGCDKAGCDTTSGDTAGVDTVGGDVADCPLYSGWQ